MTKKDFEAIAAILAVSKPVAHEPIKPGSYEAGRAYMWAFTVQKMADMCERQSPRFRRDLFYKACGY